MTIETAVAVVLLLLVLAAAVMRPRGLPEAVVALPAAALLVGTGMVPWDDAREEVERLAPVVGFLAAILVLARLCDDEGLFRACGDWLARASSGRPRRMLGGVFVTASLVTAVLSLDATVVLLTPVVLATAARAGIRPKPHLYACAHLSNTASLLLPVSNLTNLLAFAATGLSFTRFAALMTAPWLCAIAVEYLVFRRFFAADLAARPRETTTADPPRIPLFVLVVVVATLAGFVVASAAGINPAWAALAGAVLLAVPALAQGRTTVTTVVTAAALPFCAFVLGLGIVVRAVVDLGLGDVLAHVVPRGDGFAALLAAAALAAVLANLINNLPAVLALLPLALPAGTGVVLAVLIGVNLGPNVTYAGSLATLLWRRIMHQHDHDVSLGEFTRLGLFAVPAGLFAAVLALWASLTLLRA